MLFRSIENTGGGLLKSSSGSYTLKVRCEKLDLLTDVMNAISAQKNATLNSITWFYQDESARERCLLAALDKAKRKAAKVAESLGVKLQGVYDFTENQYDEEPHRGVMAMAPKMMMRARGGDSAELDLGMDIQHNKLIVAGVDVWYRVSGFG